MNWIRRSSALLREIRVAGASLPENYRRIVNTSGAAVHAAPALISLLKFRTEIIRLQQISSILLTSAEIFRVLSRVCYTFWSMN